MRIKLLIIFSLIVSSLYIVLDFERDKKIENFLNKQTELFNRLYNVHYDSYKEKSYLIFDTIVRQKPILDIYKTLQSATEDEKNKLRRELFFLLKDKYKNMQYTKLKQLHFHLKNNDSFLRMHKPTKFGDNLTKIREGIAYTNEHQVATDGFEMGRVYSGLRFVYPLMDGKEHLGSVEISFDISAFSVQFMENFKVLCNFHLNGKVLEKKTWKESIETHYLKSPVDGHYLEKRNTDILKGYASQFGFKVLGGSSKTLDKALESINNKKTISLYDKKTDSVITFLPVVNNITNEVVAFFSIRNFQAYINSKNNNFVFVFSISVLLLSIIFYLIFREFKNQDGLNRLLKQKIAEETKELKKANKQLSLFKKVIENVDAGATITEFDEELNDHVVIYSNKSFEEITGYTHDEIVGKNLRLLQNGDSDQEASKLMRDAINNKESCKVEIRNYKKDGTLFYNNVTLSPILDDDGELLNFIGIQNDITDKKLREIELKEQKNFLDILIQTAPIPFFYKDTNGNYLDVNQKWCEFTGFKREDIIGKSVYEVAPKDIADIYNEQDLKVFSLEQNPQIYESKVVNKDSKSTYDVMFYKSAIIDHDDKVVGLIGSLIDLTEIKKLQEDAIKKEKLLFEQSKLASMGEMIANIAHQWRQPLSVISTTSTGMLFQKELGSFDDKDFESSCELINQNAQFLSQTIDDFRNFIKGDSKIVKFNMKEEIDSFLNLVRATVSTNSINIIKDIDEELLLESYPNELMQCFINILNNAKDAFVTNEVQIRYLFITQTKEDNNIVISIKDNAGGIPKDILDKVFEPYFTTKHQKVGTGLGLHMTYNIITKTINGDIKVKNETYTYEGFQYTGANFIIKIPLQS